MANVVREDVVKVSYDVQQNPFGNVNKDIEDMTSGANSATRGTKSLGSTAADTAKKVAGIAGSTTIAGIKNLGSTALSTAGSLAKMTAKATIAGIGAATAGVAGLGAASIKAGAEFESSMSQVAATMGMTAEEASYSNEEYKLLADTAKKMGASTKFSASESAEALNYLALAGYDAEKACATLPTILNLAAAGGMELASASDMVTDAMSALGMQNGWIMTLRWHRSCLETILTHQKPRRSGSTSV